jgi:hypothetical protein
LDQFDLEVMHTLRTFFNTVPELAWIMLPASMSLGFCPLTLFLHSPLVEFFWPVEKFSKPPNINEPITCFLAPAGMVYAVSFGFAFQQVNGYIKSERE